MGIGRAVWIGLCQILSPLFPGHLALHGDHRGRPDRRTLAHRRSGIFVPAVDPHTRRLNRLRIPESRKTTHVPLDTEHYELLAIGFIVSFFVAWAVVAWFMNWVRDRGFVPFAVYRLILGVAVIAWAVA